MGSPSAGFLLPAIREALSETVLAIFFAILASSFVGAAILAAVERELPDSSGEVWGYLLAWTYHWALSGVMLWGLLLVPVHVWALHRLLASDSDPVQSLLIIVINQAVVSSIIIAISERGADMRRGVAAGAILIVLALIGWRCCGQTPSHSPPK